MNSNTPVCWCAPQWRIYIHGFQNLQARLEQGERGRDSQFRSIVSQVCVQTVRTILTVLRLQQFLEVLLGLLLHYRLAGADICERRRLLSEGKPRGCWNSFMWREFSKYSRRLSNLCSCFKPFSSSDTNVFICLMSIPWRFCSTTRRNRTDLTFLTNRTWRC